MFDLGCVQRSAIIEPFSHVDRGGRSYRWPLRIKTERAGSLSCPERCTYVLFRKCEETARKFVRLPTGIDYGQLKFFSGIPNLNRVFRQIACRPYVSDRARRKIFRPKISAFHIVHVSLRRRYARRGKSCRLRSDPSSCLR